jgi:hypothetical protein
MKTLFFLLLFVSPAFAQHYVSFNYLRSGIKFDGINYKNLNGFSVAYQGTSYKSNNIAVRLGFEFNYQYGNLSESEDYFGKIYDAKPNILKYEFNGKFYFNQYSLKPFAGVGLGVERFNRRLNVNPNIIFLDPFPVPNGTSLYCNYCAGITYKFDERIELTAQYTGYEFNYLTEYLSDIKITNHSESYSVGAAYIF